MLVLGRSGQRNTLNIKIRDESVEQVKEFYYLGSLFTVDSRSTKEVKRRIALAKQIFKKKRSLLINNNLKIETRNNFIISYIWRFCYVDTKHGP